MYEGYGAGRCNCEFTKTYPYAFGPRLASTYRLDDKTVLRAGWGVTYSALSNWWYVTGGSSTLGVGFNSINWTNPAFGEAALRLQDGLVYNVDDLYEASLDPGIRPSPGQLNVPPAWGAQINDPQGGRPARVNQWNIGIQREIASRVVFEAAYVGNRGVWLEANNLVSHNATSLTRLQELGLDLNNPADRTLLTSRIDSAVAASRGFKAPYPGYPGSATVAQTLRPFPQFNDGLAVRWAPLGSTWYDALQLNLTQRQWHGLSLTAAFTWQRELALGSGGNPERGRRADQQRLRSRGAERARRQLAALHLRHELQLHHAASRRKGAGRAAGRLDGGRPAAIRERRADSGARGPEQSGLADLPGHAHEPGGRAAACSCRIPTATASTRARISC